MSLKGTSATLLKTFLKQGEKIYFEKMTKAFLVPSIISLKRFIGLEELDNFFNFLSGGDTKESWVICGCRKIRGSFAEERQVAAREVQAIFIQYLPLSFSFFPFLILCCQCFFLLFPK